MNLTSYKKFYFHFLENVELKPHKKVLKNLYVTTMLTLYFSSREIRSIEGYYNNAIIVRISLNRYGSKIRKVSTDRPTLPNETILATKQEFFFAKVAPVHNITDIAILGF